MPLKIYPNALKSVSAPPTLLIIIDGDQAGWCEQFTQEGYSVIQLIYPSPASISIEQSLKAAEKEIFKLGANWGLITYGLHSKDAKTVNSLFALLIADLKACIHFCPVCESGRGFLVRDNEGNHIPTTFHLAAKQEDLHASLLPLTEDDNSALSYPSIKVYTYPRVSDSPPFPYVAKPPALMVQGEKSSLDPHMRSAHNLSYTRTLELLKRHLGPRFNFEKLWEMHTYLEFVERDAPKTMTTMVSSPYVNHVPTMTGGVGFEHLSRFYKFHFTGINVTPPDTEVITISRTIGADRIIDEMVFKCTHTTEIDYFLPGISPTGKPIEIAMVGIIAFRGDKLCFEHLYWDQASVLVQIGLLDPSNLPVAGVEATHKVLDPYGLASNTLLTRWKESEGLSIN